jgi:hypothetical protein
MLGQSSPVKFHFWGINCGNFSKLTRLAVLHGFHDPPYLLSRLRLLTCLLMEINALCVMKWCNRARHCFKRSIFLCNNSILFSNLKIFVIMFSFDYYNYSSSMLPIFFLSLVCQRTHQELIL